MTASAGAGRSERCFPDGFLWGAGTCAFSIEGAADEDGRAPSIWDTFAGRPGAIVDGTVPSVAVDHYHRWREDVDCLRRMGLNAYRFSISWSRVLPAGRGQANRHGVDFYRRLLDALLEAGITPLVDLYCWDLPQELQDRGGWASRETVDAFAEYADEISRALGDRVPLWVTHNEPWCAAMLGHAYGEHAPGLRDVPTAMQVSHHLLLSHGRAVEILRGNTAADVGIVLNLYPAEPATDRPEDVDAARRYHEHMNGWYLDAVFRGAYPERLFEHLSSRGWAPRIEDGDLERIRAPIDFLGINYYGRTVLREDTSSPFGFAEVEPASDLTSIGWEVRPQALAPLLAWVWGEYGVGRIYLTENGAAYDDVLEDGEVHDARRVRYIDRHLRAVHDAIEAGVPVAGYLVWTLMDNWECAYGFTARFGVVYTEHPSLRRVIKDSGWYLRDVAASNRLPMGT